MNSLRSIALCASLILLSISLLRAQTDNFDDNNDSGWTHFAPLGPFGGTSYLVAGGKYTLTCQPSPDKNTYGPARCGSLRQDRSYSTFLVMSDILDFNPAEDTSVGFLARIQPNPGPGATNGYAFTYQAKDTDVQISRVTGEVPANISGSLDLILETGKSYRMVFFGIGSHLEGRIYDLANPLVPLITATADDATYTQGTCGIVIFSDENTRAFASFDNYSATDGSLPPPDIAEIDGGVRVSWDIATGLPYTLYQSNDLESRFMADPIIFADGRMNYFMSHNVEFPVEFFRLRLGMEPVGAR